MSDRTIAKCVMFSGHVRAAITDSGERMAHLYCFLCPRHRLPEMSMNRGFLVLNTLACIAPTHVAVVLSDWTGFVMARRASRRALPPHSFARYAPFPSYVRGK